MVRIKYSIFDGKLLIWQWKIWLSFDLSNLTRFLRIFSNIHISVSIYTFSLLSCILSRIDKISTTIHNRINSILLYAATYSIQYYMQHMICYIFVYHRKYKMRWLWAISFCRISNTFAASFHLVFIAILNEICQKYDFLKPLRW